MWSQICCVWMTECELRFWFVNDCARIRGLSVREIQNDGRETTYAAKIAFVAVIQLSLSRWLQCMLCSQAQLHISHKCDRDCDALKVTPCHVYTGIPASHPCSRLCPLKSNCSIELTTRVSALDHVIWACSMICVSLHNNISADRK